MKDVSGEIAKGLLRTGGEESEAIEQWKRQSTENEQFLQSINVYWNHPEKEQADRRLETARQRMIYQINSSKKSTPTKSIGFYLKRIAAVFILVVTVATLSVYFVSKTDFFYQQSWVEVSTEAGQQSRIELPDGSHVWLNAETTLKYHPNKQSRNVELEGEAYFEVTHSGDYPFVVEMDDVSIKVLGTKFNASHYPNSNSTEAALLSGKILMTEKAGHKKVELKPGDKVIYLSTSHSFRPIETQVKNEILWKQGILYFDNISFDELIERLERYYAVTIRYDQDQFKNKHYTGTIDNLSISNVLEFINLTIPLNYEIDNKTIKLDLK